MKDKLIQLGLDEREASFYLQVLKTDHPTVAKVAAASGISRTSGYDITRRLSQRGLVSATEASRTDSRSRIEIEASDPEYLLMEWEARKQLLEQLVPELRAMHRKARQAARARYLEGSAGIVGALAQSLEWNTPLRAILSMKDLFQVPGKEAINQFVANRIQRKIALRVIRSREHDADAIWSSDEREFRDARFAPSSYLFTMSMLIGLESVVLISSYTENFALIIDSTEFAEMHSNLFEILWQSSEC